MPHGGTQYHVTHFTRVPTTYAQVAFNRHSGVVLASAHDHDLRVWDLRRPRLPVTFIPSAHSQKIYGIDWSPWQPDLLLSCSQDRTARVWRIPHGGVGSGMGASVGTTAADASPGGSELAPEAVVHCSEPVWRARFAPFEGGVVTIAARGNNDVRLWKLGSKTAAAAAAAGAGGGDAGGSDVSVTAKPTLVHSFRGHRNVIKSIDWRVRAVAPTFQVSPKHAARCHSLPHT